MFKRRLAVLGAVAVLAIAGLSGSAMADEPSPAAGSKVICTTSDGKTVELAQALPVQKGEVVSPDGKVMRVNPDAEGAAEEGVRFKATGPADGSEPIEAKGGVAVKRADDGSVEVRKLTPEELAEIKEGDFAKAVPAVPAEKIEPGKLVGPGGEPSQMVKVICEKAE